MSEHPGQPVDFTAPPQIEPAPPAAPTPRHEGRLASILSRLTGHKTELNSPAEVADHANKTFDNSADKRRFQEEAMGMADKPAGLIESNPSLKSALYKVAAGVATTTQDSVAPADRPATNVLGRDNNPVDPLSTRIADRASDALHSTTAKVAGAGLVGLTGMGAMAAPAFGETMPVSPDAAHVQTVDQAPSTIDLNNPSVTVSASGGIELGANGANFGSDNPSGELNKNPQPDIVTAASVTESPAPTTTAVEAERVLPDDVRSMFDNPDGSPNSVVHADGSTELYAKDIKGGETLKSEATLNAEGKKALQAFMTKNGITDPLEALNKWGVFDAAYAMPIPADGDYTAFNPDVTQTLVASSRPAAYDAATGKISFATQMPSELSAEQAAKILGRDLTPEETAAGTILACQDGENVLLGQGAELPDQIAGTTGILFRTFDVKQPDGTIIKAQTRINNTRQKCSFTITPAEKPPVEVPPPVSPPTEVPPPVSPPVEVPPKVTPPPDTGLPVTGGAYTGAEAAAGAAAVALGSAALGGSAFARRRELRGLADFGKPVEAGTGPTPDTESLPDPKDILHLQSEQPKITVSQENVTTNNGRTTATEVVNKLNVSEGPANNEAVRAKFAEALARVGKDLHSATEQEVVPAAESSTERVESPELNPEQAELTQQIDELARDLSAMETQIVEAKGRFAKMKAKVARLFASGKEGSLKGKMDYRDSLNKAGEPGESVPAVTSTQNNPEDEFKLAA